MTLKKSLYIAFLIVGIVPMILWGIISVYIGTKNVNEMGSATLAKVAETSGISFQHYLTSQNRELSLMAGIKRLQNCLESSEDGTMTDGIARDAHQGLTDWVNANRYYINAFLLDGQGKVIMSFDESLIGTDFHQEEFFLHSKSSIRAYTSPVVPSIGNSEVDVIRMGISVNYNGHVGVLVLETTLGFFDNMVKEIRVGETGESAIVDRNNTYISNTDPALYQTPCGHTVFQTFLQEYNAGIRDSTGTGVYNDENGQKRIFSYYILDSFDWIFITSQANSEINQPIRTMLESFIIALIVTVIGMVFVGRIVQKQFMNPIQKLQKVFKMAAEDKSYIMCEIEGNNEFAELSKGYNRMIETLNENFDEVKGLYKQITSQEEEIRASYELLEEEQYKTEQLAMYDHITGLANRVSFEKRLDELLSRRAKGAVIFIDLDGFKNVNDIFGHHIGDECLVETARRLSEQELELDIVSRIGGDEFVLIKLGTVDGIEIVCEKILLSIQQIYEIGNISVHLTASIGVALFPQKDKKTIDLIKEADIALYRSKEFGKNRYCVYTNAMSEDLVRQAEILDILRSAIDSEAMHVVYQPRVQMDGGPCSFEALMRINSEKYGALGPGEFIPIAESSGLIISLGEWILSEACKFAKYLLEQGIEFEVVSVNISCIQLEKDDFVEMVLETLRETGLSPPHLQLEVTESVLKSNRKESIKKLEQLREYSISIALDDFGRGYSSITYLSELPIDTLKIDKYFVDEIKTDEKKQVIFKGIIQMAHAIGISVVVEGIEELQQINEMKEMGCDSIQGFVYSYPLTEDSVLEFCKNKKIN